jgi:hypothetical protein
MLRKIIFFFSLIFLTTVFYIRFQNYKPKVLQRLTEVRGIAIEKEILPYPIGSNKISETKTSSLEQITLKTSATHEKINTFYKNILLEDNWKIETEELNESFNIVKFKKDKEIITIISSKESEKGHTVFSVEIASTP